MFLECIYENIFQYIYSKYLFEIKKYKAVKKYSKF